MRVCVCVCVCVCMCVCVTLWLIMLYCNYDIQCSLGISWRPSDHGIMPYEQKGMT